MTEAPARSTRIKRIGLVLIVCCLPCARTARTARAEGERSGTTLAAIRSEATRLATPWDRLRRKLSGRLDALEQTRAASRRDERRSKRESAQHPAAWRTRWRATATLRTSAHRQFEAVLTPLRDKLAAWLRSGRDAPPDEVARREVAGIVAHRLGVWIAAGEPESILASLEAGHAPLARVLAWYTPPDARRSFLARIVGRVAATPERTDLDALTHTVAWSALFHRARPRGAEQLDALSADLILLFTERAPDGMSRSKASFYRRGRFRDRGFKLTFQDGSDQVRHFAWAFRMFAVSKNRDLTEQLLRVKEQHDANTRKQPLSQPDLALNHAARTLVEHILGLPPAATSLSIRHIPELLRKTL